uniref:Inositol-pentakisphosphate 2-kinase n=1 Tax=Kalanchoe fedtschenkoi TaxID=63787 RepID=A0A7N0ZTB3_KALFE
MSPLLGVEHVDPGVCVHVTREFLECIQENALCQRPALRVDAATVNVHCHTALLISDHSVFSQGAVKSRPCVCVEIKPKCGFLPFSNFITEENYIKKTTTRFKMHQEFKLHHQQEISHVSEYDPIDLFSGSEDMILRAMKSLFHTPQNNFRVFLDGALVFGGLGGGTADTDVPTAIALEDALQHFINVRDGLRTDSFLKLVAKTIFKSRILDKLLQVQKLEDIDIEGAIHTYYNVISQPCTVCKSVNRNMSHKLSSLHRLPFDECLRITRDHLISATAKDCSLMVAFRPERDGYGTVPYDNVYLDSTKQSFNYKMSFIDLDMKRLEKMEHYYELDQGIVGWYNQMIHDQESNHSKGAKLCKSRVDAASDRRLNSQASAQIFHSA